MIYIIINKHNQLITHIFAWRTLTFFTNFRMIILFIGEAKGDVIIYA